MLLFGTAPGRWTILAMVLGSGIAALDGTVVGIALPAIARQFRADVASLQWVVSGYMLSLAGLLLLGGALGALGARIAGLIAVAVLPVAAGIRGTAYLHPVRLDRGITTALLIAAALCAAGGCSPRRRSETRRRLDGLRCWSRRVRTAPWTAHRCADRPR